MKFKLPKHNLSKHNLYIILVGIAHYARSFHQPIFIYKMALVSQFTVTHIGFTKGK